MTVDNDGFESVVGGDILFVKMTGLAEGSEFIGHFDGLEDNQFGNKNVSLISDGRKIVVPCSGNMGWQIQSCNRGDLLKIVYIGKEKCDTKFGKGKLVNNWKVFRKASGAKPPTVDNSTTDALLSGDGVF